MELFTRTELLIMAIVVGSLLVVIVFLTIMDIKDYLKNKKDVKKDLVVENNVSNSNVSNYTNMIKVLEEVEVLDLDEPVLTKKEEIFDEEYIAPIVDNKEDVNERIVAQEELKRVTNELESMENKDPFSDTITNFELEQEENAIISLDELAKISDNLYDNNEVYQYDDGNEPITIDEVINKFNGNLITNDRLEVSEPIKKVSVYEQKENIPFISSIYGFEKNNNELEFENTASYEKLEMEIRRNNEFLDSLKEMHEKN